MPAGEITTISSGWYCTNNPNFDVEIPWVLPADAPITEVSVSTQFRKGGETVYNHGIELSLNNTQIGKTDVPQNSNPMFAVPPSALLPGVKVQSLNLRSLHTNNAHYTLTTNFRLTVKHGAYDSRQCFTEDAVNVASGSLTCSLAFQGGCTSKVDLGGSGLFLKIPIYEQPSDFFSRTPDIRDGTDNFVRYDVPNEGVIVRPEDYPGEALITVDVIGKYLIVEAGVDTYWYQVRIQQTSQIGWIAPSEMRRILARDNRILCEDSIPDVDRDGSPSFPIKYLNGNLPLVHAPILGNPALGGTVVGNNSVVLRSVAYANNPSLLGDATWLQVKQYLQDKTVLSGWILVDNNLNRLTNVTPPPIISLSQSEFENALAILVNNNQTSTYAGVFDVYVANNGAPNYGFDTESAFTHLPISVESFCNSQTRQIRGLGLANSGGVNPIEYGQFGHEGTDFFAQPGDSVYSVANNGIVVGIGRAGDGEANLRRVNTTGYWGAVTITEANGYNVIIRYGNLFVLYGHLRTISDGIFVGSPISNGELLGTLGTFGDTHAHIEVLRYDDLPSNTLFETTLGFIANWDEVNTDRSRFIHHYEIVHLFTTNSIDAWSNDTPNRTMQQVTGINFNLGDRSNMDTNTVIQENVCPTIEMSYVAEGARFDLQTTSYQFPIPSDPQTIENLWGIARGRDIRLISPNID